MNLYPTLSKLYPQGSFGGQCFTWLHRLVDFPSVGNLIGTKIKSLNSFGIPISKLDTFKVGDIILQQYPVFGHGSFINAIVDGQLQLSESNFALNGRIDHTRLLSPHSAEILGVFRGNLMFSLPPINYPIVKHLLVLQNNQPQWNSMIQHLSNIQKWFWQASGQRVQIVAHFGWTNLTNYESVVTGDGMGGFQTRVLKREWIEKNVLPLILQIFPNIPADFVIFNMPRSEWTDSVVGHPEFTEAGFAYQYRPELVTDTTFQKPYPAFAMTALDEHDDFSPYYPAPLLAFAKYVTHELSHLLYMLCPSDKLGKNFDLTHNHFLGQNGNPIKPEDIFLDFDYAKLT
jgi:hypothetical protein